MRAYEYIKQILAQGTNFLSRQLLLPRYFPLCSLTPLLVLALALSPPSLFAPALAAKLCTPLDAALTPCIGDWVEEVGVLVGGVS